MPVPAFREPSRTGAGFTIALAVLMVAVNGTLAYLAPTTAFPYDEAFMIDTAWRIASGQRPGVDFYNPVGFGVFTIAGLLWNMGGDVRLPLIMANGVFAALIVVLTGWLLPRGMPRILRRVFLVLLAMIASIPTIYGHNAEGIGFSASYNRLSVAAIMGLMVITLSRRYAIDTERAALPRCAGIAALLNALFLIKISAFGIGLAVCATSLLVRQDWRRVMARDALVVVAILGVLLALDFWLTGISFGALLAQYREAAAARADLAASGDMARRIGASWLAFGCSGAFASYILLMDIGWRDRARALFILGIGFAAQLALNVTNTQPGTFDLLPPCLLAMYSHISFATAGQGSDGAPALSVPTLIGDYAVHVVCAMALLLQLGTGLGIVAIAARTMAGWIPTVSVTGSGRHALTVLNIPGAERAVRYVLMLRHGLHALDAAGVGKEPIMTLDYANPFPFLRQSAPPRGVAVVIAPGYMQGTSASRLTGQLFGDACIIMRPAAFTIVIDGSDDIILRASEDVLRRSFNRVYGDAHWDIFRRKAGCAAG